MRAKRPSGEHATYSYDASGQRTRAVVTQSGATTTTDYKYDGLTLLGFTATQGSASWRLDYLYDEDGALYGAVYRDPATSATPTVFAVLTTGRGDVVALIDSAGNAFCAYRYDAWGVPTATTTQATGLINSTLAASIAARQLLRYASYCYDSESALYYCSARSYDPATRQWLSRDPAEADGEESAYQYCGGEPVGGVDPSGRVTSPIKTTQEKMVHIFDNDIDGRVVSFTAKNSFMRKSSRQWWNVRVRFLMENEIDGVALGKSNVKIRIVTSDWRGERTVWSWKSGDDIVSGHEYEANEGLPIASNRCVTTCSKPGTPGSYTRVVYEWCPNVPQMPDPWFTKKSRLF